MRLQSLQMLYCSVVTYPLHLRLNEIYIFEYHLEHNYDHLGWKLYSAAWLSIHDFL